MKRIILFVILILTVAVLSAQIDRSVQPKAAPAPKINIGKPEKFTLKNGLTVFVVENHKVPAISYSLTLDIDPILEGDAVGYVDFAGGLMRTGTKTRTKAEIDEAVDFIGASLSPYSTGIYGRSLTKHSDKLLEIMADVLFNPIFPQEELDKTVTQAKSALQVSKDHASSIADNVRKTLLYGVDDPYGEIMTEETLDNITVEHLVKYHNTYFRPNVAYLVIVGDITPKEAKKQVEKYFGQWQKQDVPKHIYENPKQFTAPIVAIANKDGAAQSSIAIAHTINLTPGHPDEIKAKVMDDILGGNSFNAKLFKNLREDKAFTYGAYSNLSSNKRIGNFRAYADVRTSVTDSAIVEILKEMNIMRNELVSNYDLELTKNMIAGMFSLSLEDPQTIARFALNIERYKLPANYYQTYLQNLAAVTAQDVKEMANKYLKPENSLILAVGDVSAIKNSMKVFSPTGEVTEYNYYGKEVISTGIPAGVTAKTVVQAYIDALGGEKALNEVKELKTVATMSMHGMEAETVTLKKKPFKMKTEINTMGMTVTSVVFDGQKAKSSAMMSEPQIIEGEEAEQFKDGAVIFSELKMFENLDNLELISVEDLDGKQAYKMNVTLPDDMSTIVYFDVQTGFKLREVVVTPQGTATVSYEDYTDFDGIKFPLTVKQVFGPQSFDMKYVLIEINKGIDDSEFVIE